MRFLLPVIWLTGSKNVVVSDIVLKCFWTSTTVFAMHQHAVDVLVVHVATSGMIRFH